MNSIQSCLSSEQWDWELGQRRGDRPSPSKAGGLNEAEGDQRRSVLWVKNQPALSRRVRTLSEDHLFRPTIPQAWIPPSVHLIPSHWRSLSRSALVLIERTVRICCYLRWLILPGSLRTVPCSKSCVLVLSSGTNSFAAELQNGKHDHSLCRQTSFHPAPSCCWGWSNLFLHFKKFVYMKIPCKAVHYIWLLGLDLLFFCFFQKGSFLVV